MDTILVCSNVSPDAIDDDALAAEQLRTLAARADERGLKIAYEALAWGRHVSEYDHAWRIVEAADHPALGTCLDSFHILSRGTDLAAIDTIPGEKIFFLQLADAPHLTMDVLQWSRHYRCFPGQGALDVAGLVDRVLAAGYAGPLSLEVFNDVFRQADPVRTAIDAMRSLLVLEDRLPPPAPLDGFAFVEIGVDAELRPRDRGAAARRWASSTPARIAASRCSCGSTATSASCSTTVPATRTRRWSRSPSPAAIPAASAARAQALLAAGARAPPRPRRGRPRRRSRRRTAPPSSSAARTGSATSCPPASPAATRVPIERIDHITLAQPFEAFDEAGLFYRSRARPAAEREPGARGARRARPQPRVRQPRRPRARRAQRARAGRDAPGRAPARGVRVRDALATARAMRERGVPLLAVPRQLLRRPGRRGWSSSPRCWTSCASSTCSTTAVPTASSCTSTRPTSAGACSSRCSSGAAATAATAPRIHPSEWQRFTVAEERDATAGRA